MSDHIQRLQRVVDDLFSAHTSLRVLEAGCGSMSFLDLKEKARIVGIDISLPQLQRNKLISESIHGDIMTHEFAPDDFDVIVCIDVLEHLDHPELALDSFQRAVAPGGIIVLKLPNVWSVKGLVTKLTPHRFHVWFYHTVYGRKDAGKEDTAPFKTHLKLNVGPGGLRRWCRRQGLDVLYEDYYESCYQQDLVKRFGWFGRVSSVMEALIRVLSCGRLSFLKTEYMLVARKPETSRRQASVT